MSKKVRQSKTKAASVKRKRNKSSEIRQFTRVYTLNNIISCRNMFIHTFQISTKRVDTAVKKFKSTIIKDAQGNIENLNKALPDETKNKIISRISSFLPTNLTLSKMHSLYLEDQNPKVKDTCNICDKFQAKIKSCQNEPLLLAETNS